MLTNAVTGQLSRRVDPVFKLYFVFDCLSVCMQALFFTFLNFQEDFNIHIDLLQIM